MKKTLLYELNITRQPVTNLRLLRLIADPEFTRVDFGYVATSYFVSGGWIRISADTYIVLKETGEKLKLTNAEHIPLAPEQHHFDSNKDWQFFSLYFPAIPQKELELDIIEVDENPDEHDFNFYNVYLDPEKAIRINTAIIS